MKFWKFLRVGRDMFVTSQYSEKFQYMEVSMSSPKSIKTTDVWQKTHLFVNSVVSLSNNLPQSEIYGLKTRLQECATSVPTNIEDGLKQSKKIEKIRAFIKANGFIEECKDYLSLVAKLKYGETSELLIMADEISALLASNQYRGLN